MTPSSLWKTTASFILLLASLCLVQGKASFRRSSFGVTSVTEEVSTDRIPFQVLRGGATLEDEEIEFESSDEDETDEEDTHADPKLTKATQAAATTVKQKVAKAAIENAVRSKSNASGTKGSSSLVGFFRIPYILKASLNPLTLIKMTQGYFASLVNLDYLNERTDANQDLRSALEEKAKKTVSGTSSNRGKRKFKPGQAKTLSDLPQLNT